MNSSYKLLVLVLFSILCCSSNSYTQTKDLHILKIKSTDDLHNFFSYTGNDIPIVSGHRGGTEMGFPENSIAAFENTLTYNASFFEIDPRLTKDSIIVLLHDATLDRTTTGKGKVSDYTLEELRKLRLKDVSGKVTSYQIPTLEEAIIWARGKTILSLDWKGVPYEMTASLILKHHATAYVMVGIQKIEQAKYYLTRDKDFMFAMLIKTPEQLDEIRTAGIPLKQVMAYVGSKDLPENQSLYSEIHKRNMMCMIACAPVYDKLKSSTARESAYQTIIGGHVDIIESDLPIEAYRAVSTSFPSKSPKAKYYGIQKGK